MTIREPRPNEIQVDLDGFPALESFCLRLAILRRNIPHVALWRTDLHESKTRGHYHATVTLPTEKLPLDRRVLMAALLGSDGVREVLNFCRVANGRRVPVAFFEVPHESD